MYVKEVTVENQVGLHARPATFFIQKANELDRKSTRLNSSHPSSSRMPSSA